jgi:predicted transcriptional regulator
VPLVSPDGPLTPAQYEILEAAWTAGADGVTVAEIWQSIGQSRQVARTTVLNLVDRLEKRGWLKRRSVDGVNRYTATRSRDQTSGALANDFVDDFFGGSAPHLVMSLLGSGRLSADDVRQLRKLLDSKRDSNREGPR